MWPLLPRKIGVADSLEQLLFRSVDPREERAVIPHPLEFFPRAGSNPQLREGARADDLRYPLDDRGVIQRLALVVFS